MNINELKGVVKQVISESSLSRIQEKISKHDCATITAFRNDPTDDTYCAPDYKAPSLYQQQGLSAREINMRNNNLLRAALLDKGFSVTPIDGTYIENFGTDDEIEVKENSFFVANTSSLTQEEFFGILIDLGKKFCQDSIMLIPMGGENARLHGTNTSAFPGLDQSVSYKSTTYGKKKEFMSKVRNRPFAAVNENFETYKDLTGKQRMAVRAMAHKLYNS